MVFLWLEKNNYPFRYSERVGVMQNAHIDFRLHALLLERLGRLQ